MHEYSMNKMLPWHKRMEMSAGHLKVNESKMRMENSLAHTQTYYTCSGLKSNRKLISIKLSLKEL